LAGDAVLGAEERDKFYIVRVGKDVNRAAALRVHPCLIGDQADAFAAQWREILLFEHVNARFRVVGRLRERCWRRIAVRCAGRNCADTGDGGECEQNHYETDTKHDGGGFVVRHATVCYIQPRDASVNLERSEWVQCVNSEFSRSSCSY
jgi:hypothetical protein